MGDLYYERTKEKRNVTTYIGNTTVWYVDNVYESSTSKEKNVPGHVEFYQGMLPYPKLI